ncbi:MAG: tetratricopeptide repeat protein, partial [Bradymonadaceae bacterium]
MTHVPKFQDALVALPSVIAIEALVPGGIEAMPSEVYRALRKDEVGEAMEAAEDWYQTVKEQPGEEREAAQIAYALLMENCDLLDEAVEFARERRREAEEDAALTLVEAEILLERGETEKADELVAGFCEEYADGTEVDGSVWGFAADLLLDVGRDDEAIDCYEKAVSLGTEDFETVIRLAKLRQQREEWHRGAECFELAADLGGDVAGPWAEAAECWRQAGELRKSLQARDQFLDQRTGDAETWAKQGIGYRHVGDGEQ